MKAAIIIIILIVIPYILADFSLERVIAAADKIHNICLPVSKVDLTVLGKAENGDIDETNPALVEHIYCFAKQAGVMKNDQMQYDVVRKHIESIKGPGSYKELSAKCDSIRNTDPKLLATLHLKCLYRYTKDKYIHL